MFLYYGTQTITAGETTLIVSMSQLFQVLFAYLFLKEALSKRFLSGLFVCASGITIIAFQNSIGMSFNFGVIYVLLAAVTNAVFFVLQKPLLKKYTPLEVISYASWIVTLMMLPFGLNIFSAVSTAPVNATAAIVYMATVTIIAHLCWSTMLAKIEASRAAVYLYIIPVLTIVIGYFWLGEMPSLLSIFGGAVILGGVIYANSKTSKPDSNQPQPKV